MLSEIGDDLIGISKRVLELTPLKNRTIKIAISGLSRSGKSVFITSFIDQLLNNKNLFLHKNSKTFKAKLTAPNLFMKRFDYYHYEKMIKVEHQWCDGTDSISSALLKFQTKGKIPFIGDEEFYVKIVDYPGEWLLDLNLISHTYSSWSKSVLDWLKNIDDKKVKEYLKKIDNLSTNDTSLKLETSLHVEYVELVKHLKSMHYSYITPGRFLVSGDLKDDPILIFAPINKSNSKLHEVFKARFDKYVKEIVKKIHLDYFKGFDRQIVLIDVIEALQNGYDCYMDMKLALQTMFCIYSHAQGNFLSRIINPSIEKVAFVATKADLVPSSFHQNYLSLLKQISEDLKRGLEDIDVQTFLHIVSSVKCTKTIIRQKDGLQIECLQGLDKENGKMVEVYPGYMPAHFPKKDSKISFMYEDFLPPKKDYKDKESFGHINLDRLIWDILGDML